MSEPESLARETVEIRRFHHWIARATQRVETPVIGKENENIGRSSATGDGGVDENNEETEKDFHNSHKIGNSGTTVTC